MLRRSSGGLNARLLQAIGGASDGRNPTKRNIIFQQCCGYGFKFVYGWVLYVTNEYKIKLKFPLIFNLRNISTNRSIVKVKPCVVRIGSNSIFRNLGLKSTDHVLHELRGEPNSVIAVFNLVTDRVLRPVHFM